MSLKDALMKAGLKSTKSENMRSKIDHRTAKKSEKHQQERNFCEVCTLIQPDVERYKHRNPTVDAEWICAACADKEQILDEFRVTHQSEFARSGRFRREFGATKDFSEATFQKRDRDQRGGKKPFDKNKKKFDGRKKKFDSRKPNNRKDNGNKSKKKTNYTIDEDGEKNFNC